MATHLRSLRLFMLIAETAADDVWKGARSFRSLGRSTYR